VKSRCVSRECAVLLEHSNDAVDLITSLFPCFDANVGVTWHTVYEETSVLFSCCFTGVCCVANLRSMHLLGELHYDHLGTGEWIEACPLSSYLG